MTTRTFSWRPFLIATAVTVMTADDTIAQSANPQRRQPSIQRRVSIPRNHSRSAQQEQTSVRMRQSWHAQQFRLRQARSATAQRARFKSPHARDVFNPKNLFEPPTLPFLRPGSDTGNVHYNQPQRTNTLRPNPFDPPQAQKRIGQHRNTSDSNQFAINRYGSGLGSLSIGKQRNDGSVDYWNIRNQRFLFGFKTGNTARDLHNSRTGTTLFGLENPDGSVDYLDPFSGQWNFATPAQSTKR